MLLRRRNYRQGGVAVGLQVGRAVGGDAPRALGIDPVLALLQRTRLTYTVPAQTLRKCSSAVLRGLPGVSLLGHFAGRRLFPPRYVVVCL